MAADYIAKQQGFKWFLGAVMDIKTDVKEPGSGSLRLL